ncbi:MAG: HAD-IA family hydrolase [Oscillospiraceae bacterium]|nr:HAD-IA family hydrolase [Oscillospiraceae bacterium]
MGRYDTVLFDLDGTLTDSAPGILNCVRYALDRMGLPEPENMLRFVGPPLIVSFGEFCGLDSARAAEAVGYYRERYRDIGIFENKPYDGVFPMLDSLKAAGIRLAVATGKPEAFSLRILEKFGLMGYFEFLGGDDFEGSRKEKHTVIEYVLSALGDPDREGVLMVGDRMHDVIGAHESGIKCLGALWGYGGSTELEKYGADLTAEDPQSAARIILSDI